MNTNHSYLRMGGRLIQALPVTLSLFAGIYSVSPVMAASASEIFAVQQSVSVTGSVVDGNGEPLIGVNVLEKGTQNGTITNFDGKFTLDVSSPNAIIVFSYIGFENQELKASAIKKVVLVEDSKALDEVVVVGYGVQKKRDLTGAISSVKMDDAPVNTFTTVSQALAGKAAGLQVSQVSAQAGGGSTFRIRGAASTGAGNDPLIIIDGIPVTSGVTLESGNKYNSGNTDNVLGSLNPNDIESIEVLKDASSTAIYGARAGHGVIIVTTKRGKAQKAQVRYSGNVTIQTIKKKYDILNGSDFLAQQERYNYEKYLSTTGQGVYEGYLPSKSEEYKPRFTADQIAAAETTDWFDKISRNGFMQSHNVSVTGGSEKTQYMVSLNYMGQKGAIEGNKSERFSGKINLDQTLSKYFKTGISLNVSRNNYDNVPLGDGANELSGVIAAAVTFNPTLPVYDENGDYMLDAVRSQVPNPVSLLEISDKQIKERLLGAAYIQAEPIKGLILKANFGIDRQYDKRKQYIPKTTLQGAQDNGAANIAQADRNSYLMELTANYSKDFGNHSINALVGYSWQQFLSESVTAGNKDFLTDVFLYNNLGSGSFPTPIVKSSADKSAIGSYFARLNYSYLGRYLLTATLRADGASNFAPDHRWGYFPSVSAGWRFSDEPFMRNLTDVVSNGKLRVSYGQTGNYNVGYRIMDYYNVGGDYKWAFGNKNTLYQGAYVSQLGNPFLTWETTSEFNIGLDLGFFNNRISTSIEYFNRTISDLLNKEKTLPSYNEVNKIASNIGKTQSQGVEFTLNTVNVTNKDWYWGSDVTISFYRDRWKERDPNWIAKAYESTDDWIRASYGYVSDGLLQPGEAVPEHQPTLLPGQVKLKDLCKDGVLDDKDKVMYGSQDPKFIFGFNNTVTYKNFDLNVYFYGQVGAWKGESYYAEGGVKGKQLAEGQNVSYAIKDTWTHDNQNAKYPSLLGPGDNGVGDFFMHKVSFLRCRNITLGYSIPVSPKVFNKIRVYADVNNPFVITNWDGIDPETEGNQFSYPNVMSFSLGVDITF